MGRIVRRAVGPGKFEGGSTVSEYIFEMTAGDSSWWTDQFGDTETTGWYALVDLRGAPVEVQEDDGSVTRIVAAILHEDSRGFVDVDEFETWEEAERKWKLMESDFDDMIDDIVLANESDISDWMAEQFDGETAEELAEMAADDWSPEDTLRYRSGEVAGTLVDVAKAAIAGMEEEAAENPSEKFSLYHLVSVDRTKEDWDPRWVKVRTGSLHELNAWASEKGFRWAGHTGMLFGGIWVDPAASEGEGEYYFGLTHALPSL
jgi:hypothetical protein